PSTAHHRVLFTEDMRKDYTILCPQMSPIHFDLLEPAFKALGYNLHVMQNDNRAAIDMGLKYVNNDACYPSLWVVGQIMDELHSGKYDLNKTAVLMSQTGGGCRATNYVGFIRRALQKAHMEQVPVISINLSKLEANPGFHINLKMLYRVLLGAILGDVMMRCVYRMRPYEKEKGSVNACHEKWKKACQEFIGAKKIRYKQFRKLCRNIIEDFDHVPVTDEVKPRVGVVGEILVKFAPAANNHLVDLLEAEGAEAVVPDLLDFMMYSFYDQIYKAEELGTSRRSALLARAGIQLIEWMRKDAAEAFARSAHFDPPVSIFTLVDYAKPIVSIGNETGEGWFLTAEMIELIEEGAPNIVCTQPFGCLPNHIVGKGVIKELRRRYPAANIVAIDYDPGASEVNQLNRIKLMLSGAQRKAARVEQMVPAGRGTDSMEARKAV
ncbi:MAG: 2-hydroxyacyl-CoA dehydratase, partial [Lachnospiraceae bacterium]|nr:2-hydroxyacyl-CoA dehydratase [Lachnospiraceae bacterium]